MKNIFFRKVFLLLSMAAAVCMWSCKDEDQEDSAGTPSLTKITTIKDVATSITSGSMGDWIAIHGTNLRTATAILFSDVEVDMGQTYYEGDVLYLEIPVKLPIENTNQLTVKTRGGETSCDFVVNIPALELTSIFNEYTSPGDTLKIYGKFLDLYEVSKENTVIMFGDISSPVIESTSTYITAKVPVNVQPNVVVKAINSQYSAEAICPFRYKDQQYMITSFDDDFPYPFEGIGAPGTHAEWVGQWERPKPISGNYMKLEVDQATYPDGLGWFYLFENNPVYFDHFGQPGYDMVANPEKYVLKFELNMYYPVRTTTFHIYYHWGVAPMELSGETFTIQTLGTWQTVSIPLEKIFIKDPNYYDPNNPTWTLNMRVQSFAPVETLAMYFDNLRISLK